MTAIIKRKEANFRQENYWTHERQEKEESDEDLESNRKDSERERERERGIEEPNSNTFTFGVSTVKAFSMDILKTIIAIEKASL